MVGVWKYFLFAPIGKCETYTHWEKVQIFFSSNLGMWHIKIFVMIQGTQIWCFLKINIMIIGNIAKNVILGVNNTPNLPLNLMYFFSFWNYRPAKYVKLTKILICIMFQLGTIFFQTITMSKTHLSTLGAIMSIQPNFHQTQCLLNKIQKW